MGKRKSLNDFFGLISEEEGEEIFLAHEKRRAINRKLKKRNVRFWNSIKIK